MDAGHIIDADVVGATCSPPIRLVRTGRMRLERMGARVIDELEALLSGGGDPQQLRADEERLAAGLGRTDVRPDAELERLLDALLKPPPDPTGAGAGADPGLGPRRDPGADPGADPAMVPSPDPGPGV